MVSRFHVDLISEIAEMTCPTMGDPTMEWSGSEGGTRHTRDCQTACPCVHERAEAASAAKDSQPVQLDQTVWLR